MSRFNIFFLFILLSGSDLGSGNNGNIEQSCKELSTKINEFAIEILKQTEDTENQFFSPFSIHSAFSMLSLGAKGNTLNQLEKALHLPQSEEALISTYQSFIDLNSKLRLNEGRCDLSIANRLFAENSTKLLNKFENDVFKYFGAEIENLKFMDNIKESVNVINNWVSNQTKGKIQEIVTEDDIDPNTRLFLVNAINFLGKWKHEFNPNLTMDGDFWLTKSKSKQVRMMRLEKTRLKHSIVEQLECTAVELPYDGDALAMVILVPNSENISINEIKRNISIEVLASINFDEEDVVLTMPKLKFEKSYQLIDLFKKLKVENLFNPGNSDLSGIDGSTDLYVSKALHKAVIEVNEEGTEASAVTSIAVKTRKATRLYVTMDRPFFFFIKDNDTGVILFIGQVTEP